MNKRGFSLVEVMIVLAILGAIITLGAPRIFRKDNNIKSVARHFIVLSKETRNKARLSGTTYRLVVKMDPTENTYWIEKASGPALIDLEAAEKEKDRKDEENPPPPLFQIDKSLTKKESSLPGDLRFSSVETANMKEPVTSGVAYVHFFPEGFVEAAAVQISGPNNLTWTLVFNPLTGQADIVEKAQSLKDIRR